MQSFLNEPIIVIGSKEALDLHFVAIAPFKARLSMVARDETALISLAAPIKHQERTVETSRRTHSLGRIEIPKGMEHAI